MSRFAHFFPKGLVSICVFLAQKHFGIQQKSAFADTWFLVEKKPIAMYFHMVTVAFSTWSHAEHVIENDYLTLKQKQKNVANTKQDAGTKLSCGTLKTLLPT